MPPRSAQRLWHSALLLRLKLLDSWPTIRFTAIICLTFLLLVSPAIQQKHFLASIRPNLYRGSYLNRNKEKELQV